MKTKYLTIGFLFVLLVIAAVVVVSEAKPVSAVADSVCANYASVSCGGLTGAAWMFCVQYNYYQCTHPIVLPDTVVVAAD